MHLLVTDRLACVRCGPGFGLILLADELADRRVLRGRLGCANCREAYPVEGGFGDFRPPPRSVSTSPPEPPPDEGAEEALRVAAMLGVTEGPGLILLAGAAAGQASRLASMIEGIEVAALHPGLRDGPEEAGVSRMQAGERLPFFTASLRGVVLDQRPGSEAGHGVPTSASLEEALRVLAPGARLVIRHPTEGVADHLGDLGAEAFLETARAVVAVRG